LVPLPTAENAVSRPEGDLFLAKNVMFISMLGQVRGGLLSAEFWCLKAGLAAEWQWNSAASFLAHWFVIKSYSPITIMAIKPNMGVDPDSIKGSAELAA
jgi:hypothetical protein